MSRKVGIWIGVGVVALVGIIFMYPMITTYMKSRTLTVNTKQVEFYIKKKTSLEDLTKELKALGIIDQEEDFLAVGQYKGLDESNIALGKYLIDPGSQYRTLLNGFTLNDAGNGNGEVEVEVTFTNCRDINDLSGKVSKCIMVDSAKLVEKLKSNSTLEKYAFTLQQLPAMFIPNTYQLFYDTDEEQFIARMAEEFKLFWNDSRMQQLKEIGLKSPSQAVTLASIVYAEQNKNPSEWPIIAGLYLNRIAQGIKLQSDPTFRFCWGKQLDGVERLLNVHRDIDCPYNTYKINGLPPGPICIPPPEVTVAVLNRKKHNYIFMMAQPNYSGMHDFTVEYADHERLAGIYQRWLSQEQAGR
jgi:UPF0755 protein